MTQMKLQQDHKLNWRNLSATRVVTSTLGILVGLAGIEHGFFEMLQGNVKPSGIFIEAIGPEQRFWENGLEPAVTIIPNFLVTGILAMIFGILVTIWAGAFVERKYGARVLFLLSIILWLVGGGFAPIIFTIIASVTATRINKPLTWWRTNLPVSVQGFLSKIWPGVLIAFVLGFWISVELIIFGYPLLWFFNADTTFAIVNILAFIYLGLMAVSILTGFAYDIQNQPDSQQAPAS